MLLNYLYVTAYVSIHMCACLTLLTHWKYFFGQVHVRLVRMMFQAYWCGHMRDPVPTRTCTKKPQHIISYLLHEDMAWGRGGCFLMVLPYHNNVSQKTGVSCVQFFFYPLVLFQGSSDHMWICCVNGKGTDNIVIPLCFTGDAFDMNLLVTFCSPCGQNWCCLALTDEVHLVLETPSQPPLTSMLKWPTYIYL